MARVFTGKDILRPFGLLLSLLFLTVLISPATSHMWGIAYFFVWVFGLSFYWVFSPAMVVLGIFLLFKSSDIRKHVKWNSYLGFFVFLLGFGVLFGFLSAKGLGDFFSLENMGNGIRESFANHDSPVLDVNNGGGLVFASLGKALNGVGEALSVTITVILMLGGLSIIFYRQIAALIKFISFKSGSSLAKRRSKAAERKAQEEAKVQLEEYIRSNTPMLEEAENVPLSPSGSQQIIHNELPKTRSELYRSENHIDTYIPLEREVEPLSSFDEVDEDPSYSGFQTVYFDVPSKPKPATIDKPIEKPVAKPVIEKKEEPALANEMPLEELEEEPIKEEPIEESVIETPTVQEEIVAEEDSIEPEISFAEEEPNETVEEEPAIDSREEEKTYEAPEPIIEEPKAVLQEVKPSEPAPVEEKKKDPWAEARKLGIEKATELPPYTLPPLTLLHNYPKNDEDIAEVQAECQRKVDTINEVFSDFGAGAKVVGYTIGPAVTRYDIQPDKGVSVSSITKYIKDICARLGGVFARYEEVVIGKTTSGLEIANDAITPVSLHDLVEAMAVEPRKGLMIPFGRNISNQPVFADLAKFPHFLVSGTTGSGKSMFAHSILLSFLMRNRPEDLKLVLIDPKNNEMKFYIDVPHLLCPVIVTPEACKKGLEKLVDEMEKRNAIFAYAGVRDIKGYNEVYAPQNGVKKLPYIVIFFDEYADFAERNKDIPKLVQRLAQKARSAGIHLIISTQRPSVKVIDGVIKANLPAAVALKTKSFEDSRVILGKGGAEELNGNGDMLVSCDYVQRNGFARCQGCLVEDDEIKNVIQFCKDQAKPVYDVNFLHLDDPEPDENNVNTIFSKAELKAKSEEDIYQNIKKDIMNQEYTSISKIQRTYMIGFPHAGKIFARLQSEGIVGQPESASSAKGCRVLVHESGYDDDGFDSLGGDNG